MVVITCRPKSELKNIIYELQNDSNVFGNDLTCGGFGLKWQWSKVLNSLTAGFHFEIFNELVYKLIN